MLEFLAKSPKNVKGSTYDFYTDSFGNMYAFDCNSNILKYYIPNLELSKFGDEEIEERNAVLTANDFLEGLGYDTSEFTISHSPSQLKEFKISYYKEDELIMKLKLKADSEGNACVTYFENCG